MSSEPSLAPDSSPYPAYLLTSDNGHTKYIYQFQEPEHLSSGSLSSETIVRLRLSWILIWKRLWLIWPGSWGENGGPYGKRKKLVLVLGAFISDRCGRQSLQWSLVIPGSCGIPIPLWNHLPLSVGYA